MIRFVKLQNSQLQLLVFASLRLIMINGVSIKLVFKGSQMDHLVTMQMEMALKNTLSAFNQFSKGLQCKLYINWNC